jgi:hypothetical protein
MRVLARAALLATLSLVAPSITSAGPAVDSWGLRGGLAFSTLRGVEARVRGGISAGAFVRHQLTPGIEIQPELLYVQKGVGAPYVASLLTVDAFSAPQAVAHRYDYVELPLLLALTPPALGPSRVSVFFGPSFALKAKELTETTSEGVTTASKSDALHDTDLGVVAGLGFRTRSKPVGWILDARWDNGLTDIGGAVVGRAGRNSSVQITTGVEF